MSWFNPGIIAALCSSVGTISAFEWPRLLRSSKQLTILHTATLMTCAHSSRHLSGLEASTSGRVVQKCSPATALRARGHQRSHVCSRQARLRCPLTVAAAKGPSAPQRKVKQERLDLPPGDFSKIKSSVFVGSSVDLKGCPPQDYPEFAVIGRSNVGKSSLINMLTQNSKLAKVSKEPGVYSY